MANKATDILGVSARTFREIEARLRQVQHPTAFARADEGLVVLDGLAIRAIAQPTTTVDEDTTIEVASILSARTHHGMVELTLNTEATQMDVSKAREVVGMLHGAIEAAISDQILYTFLTERVGLSPEKASAALLDFRELRQGSRGTVFPH